MTEAKILTFVVERPVGFARTFDTPSGCLSCIYPRNYGFIPGLINPEDDEEVDAFRGEGGPHWGRFMKGKIVDGAWSPDETKWFYNCDIASVSAILKFWCDQSPILLSDLVVHQVDPRDHLKLVADDACRHVGAYFV